MQEFYKCDFSSFKRSLNSDEENGSHETTAFPELVIQNDSLESVNKETPQFLIHLSDTVSNFGLKWQVWGILWCNLEMKLHHKEGEEDKYVTGVVVRWCVVHSAA